MILTNFLASNSYIITNKFLIQIVGLESAILLGELCSEYNYWNKTNQLTDDEWFFSTRENIENNTGLSDYKQRVALNKLIEKKLILTRRMGVPCKVYYKINENEIIKLCNEAKKQDSQNFKNKNLKNLTSSSENFEELDIESFNINNNKKSNNKNNKEYSTPYKKKNYNPNFEQREYPPGFFDQFYCN